jgi:cytosine/adenosine deaminase-related metal-dependent hydrolase
VGTSIEMTTLYSAHWVLPISTAPIADGAVVVDGERIVAVGKQVDLVEKFPQARLNDFGEAAILPGLVNAHSHLELTAMRGFLEAERSNFFAWLRKLTIARMERMTADDLYVSAAWGASEAVRAGVTCVADSSDSASQSMRALLDVGLRGTVYQESFGPDPRLANENFDTLKAKVEKLRDLETVLVRAGVSPHAVYTVCAEQMEMISQFAIAEKLPLMIHAAESDAESLLIREGCGPFAESFARRGIEWRSPGASTIRYLESCGVLKTKPLLAHCIKVDDDDIEKIKASGASIAHCPKSNAKLGHGRAPFAKFLESGIPVGLGSDSVASNNTCDILEEARFAALFAGSGSNTPDELRAVSDNLLASATLGGALALGRNGQVGELKEGLQADLIAVSLNGAHQLPSYDPVTTLIFSSSGHDVSMTVVAGKEVYCDGHVTTIDEEYLRPKMGEIADKLRF